MFVLLLPIKPLRNWGGGSLLIFLKIILQIIAIVDTIPYLFEILNLPYETLF